MRYNEHMVKENEPLYLGVTRDPKIDCILGSSE